MSLLERVQILVTHDQRRWLEAEAARRGEPITAVVRSAIDAARLHRTETHRLQALDQLEGIWAQPIPRVSDLTPETINEMTDGGRLMGAMHGLAR